jgi:hypothetical protein
MSLEEKTKRLQELIGGLTVLEAVRSKPGGLFIQLSNQTRLFVDAQPDGTLELSVTGGSGLQDEA